MSRVSTFLLLLLIFSACKNKSPDIIHSDAVLSGIRDATDVITSNSNHCIGEMTDRTKDPHKAEKAQSILPRMSALHSSAENINELIQICIDKIVSPDGHDSRYDIVDSMLTYGLFKSLQEFKAEVLQIDEGVDILFKDKSHQLAASFPDDKDNYFTYSKSVAGFGTSYNALLFLYTLKMELRLIENKVMSYCMNTYDSYFCGIYRSSFLIGMSVQKVHPKDYVEIEAGMGYFSVNNVRKIEIDNLEVPLTNYGTVNYRFKAESKPGKKQKLIKIYYVDEFGIDKMYSRSIEYEVIK